LLIKEKPCFMVIINLIIILLMFWMLLMRILALKRMILGVFRCCYICIVVVIWMTRIMKILSWMILIVWCLTYVNVLNLINNLWIFRHLLIFFYINIFIVLLLNNLHLFFILNLIPCNHLNISFLYITLIIYIPMKKFLLLF